MSVPQQGDVWWAQTEVKRRPVLVVTRSHATPVLKRVVVAPVSRIGTLGQRRHEICETLRALADC